VARGSLHYYAWCNYWRGKRNSRSNNSLRQRPSESFGDWKSANINRQVALVFTSAVYSIQSLVIQMIDRNDAYKIVLESLQEVFIQVGTPAPDSITEDSVLVGSDSILDSLGVVSLIVEIEQRLESLHGISVILANDKAMSQRNSPFRTVGVLTDHVLEMAKETST
jgi:acyl carrier protein